MKDSGCREKHSTKSVSRFWTGALWQRWSSGFHEAFEGAGFVAGSFSCVFFCYLLSRRLYTHWWTYCWFCKRGHLADTQELGSECWQQGSMMDSVRDFIRTYVYVFGRKVLLHFRLRWLCANNLVCCWNSPGFGGILGLLQAEVAARWRAVLGRRTSRGLMGQ